MATLEVKNKPVPVLGAPAIAEVRNLDIVVDLAKDVTMGTATDVINLATLPKGTVVLAATLEQLEPGTGSGTLVARVGTTAVTAALTATDAAGTVVASAGTFPIVNTAATELNLLGATAVRTAGRIRVHVITVETSAKAVPVIANRDTTLL